ncbi:MAG: hypothetical protein HQK87_03530 [Nitrospinae bacterium]|nr:hypothetical protein [Nitrospinota bacterium]
MDIGTASAASGAANTASVGAQQKPGGVDTAVAKTANEVQKAEGAQMVDMIQKAGSVINVTA